MAATYSVNGSIQLTNVTAADLGSFITAQVAAVPADATLTMGNLTITQTPTQTPTSAGAAPTQATAPATPA